MIGQNILVVLVYSLWMVFKKLIITVMRVIKTVWKHSLLNMFNFFEFLNTVFTSIVVVSIARVLPLMFDTTTLSSANPRLLEDVNRIAYLYETTTFYMGLSVYCLCFRLFRLPQFSLYANLPFATMMQGRKDIVNILVILFIFTLSNALCAYIVFCPSIREFETLNSSVY